MKSFGDLSDGILERIKKLQETAPKTEYHYECEKCKDIGGTYTETVIGRKVKKDGSYIDTTGIVFKECECVKKKRALHAFKKSNISGNFQTKTFENFEMQGIDFSVVRMQQVSQMYVEVAKEGENLLLSGQAGSGKTHLVSAVANELLNKGKDVYYVPYLDLMNEVAANGFEGKGDIIKRLNDCEVLVIDDLHKPTQGKPTAHKWQVDIMAEVINYRYFNKKSTVVSTELFPQELLMIDEATYSRVLEGTKGTFIAKVERDLKNNFRLRGIKF